MNLTVETMHIDDVAPAWRALDAVTPVKLRAIRNERDHRAMTSLMNELLEEIGDREKHPLMGLLDVVSLLVESYEREHVRFPDADPVAVLRFLMQQHGLRQADLAELFGSQSNVSEILTGKREINVRQARALAKRFSTSPAAFI